jgi:putative aldouronate transport system substrate-binding protein
MKRIVLSVLMVFVLVSSLTAGGKRQDTAVGPASVQRTGEKPDPFAKYAPAITLTSVRTMGPTDQFDQSDPEKRSYEENRWIRTFREEMGINLKYNWIAPDADSATAKWNANIAAGDIPDFSIVNDNIYKQLLDADLIANMTQIFADYATDEYKATLLSADYDMMTVDGKMYGFPAGKKAMAGTTLLFVRQDWLDKVRLPAPETIDDVVKVAKAFKAAGLGGSDTIGLLLGSNISGGTSFEAGDGKWDGFLNGYGAYLNYWLVKDGKLAYSTVQPEMRRALLGLQALYKDGTINRDFAVLNNVVAREYVASGKVGIFYSTAWNVTQGMNTLVKTDPNARITHLYPPPAEKGKVIPIQTNSPKGWRIFVSNKSRNPEAVVKMAVLSYHSRFSERQFYYMSDEAGFPYYKFLPWGDTFNTAEEDLTRSVAIRDAELTGNTETLEKYQWTGTYTQYQLAKEGKSEPWNLMLYGPGGAYSSLYDYYTANRLLIEGFNGLPTDTMLLKGGIINAALGTAMFEVVMGADISVFDRAVEKWYADGGTQITAEVNRWYSGLKK